MTGQGRVRSAALQYDTGSEPERDGVYCHTRNHNGHLPPLDYARVHTEEIKAHSAIVATSASISDEGTTSVNMAVTLEELAQQLEAYAHLPAQQQQDIPEQKQTIESLHAMMMQLLKSAKEKKDSRHDKKKQASTPFEILEEEMNAIHVELFFKHSEPPNSKEGSSQCINELERFLDSDVTPSQRIDAASRSDRAQLGCAPRLGPCPNRSRSYFSRLELPDSSSACGDDARYFWSRFLSIWTVF